MNHCSESRSFSPNASPNNPRQPSAALSVPPTEPLSPGASPMVKDCLNPRNTTIDDPALQVDRRKRSVQYTLFQGGDHDEDCGPPMKELETMQTTWNRTTAPSSEVFIHLNERQLELSHITRRTIAARLRYQRLRAHELDLIKSILEDEKDLSQRQLNERHLELSRITRRTITAKLRYQRLRAHELDLIGSILEDEKDLSQKQLNDIDLQIGAVQNTLQDGGVKAIGDEGRKFDSSDYAVRFKSALEARDDEFMFASGSDGSSSCASEFITST
ncbi:hypothetical protein M405DRAFT_818932 [Rhizopogon salebrosus TDB-379]|nr:hypothetical protein M405DRAFT_818932 [Rhizopogon salebrosus TDB-379]